MLGLASKTYFNSLSRLGRETATVNFYSKKKKKSDNILSHKGLGLPHTKTAYNELMKVTHSGQL